MTGRARIGGLSRQQHVWSTIHDSPSSMSQRQVYLAVATLGFSLHQVDHHLRRLYEAGAVRRERVRYSGVYRYLYRTVGTMPPDLRLGDDKRRAEARTRWKTPFCLDTPTDEGDNWNGERCVRKTGTPSEIPAIPSLADLLAR